MQDLVKTPEKSVMIIYNVFHDNRLAKSPTKRLRTAFIYGLLRRTFNNSLNHLDKFYSKKYGTVYCVNQITTLINRSGFKRNTIFNSFKSLKKYGYIDTKYNPHRHVNFIFMPKVMANEVKGKNISNGVSLKNKRGWFKKQTNVGLKNKRRCSEHNNNEHNIVSTHSDNPEPKLIQWIKNYGLGKSINNYLIKHNDNLTNAYHEAHKIIDIKNDVNQNNGVKYRSSYFNSENNPYIQNGGLLSALKNGKNISKDYEHYLKNHHKPNDTYNSKNHHPIKPKYDKEERALLDDKPDKLHRTNKKLQNKVKNQLKDLGYSHTPKKSTSKNVSDVATNNYSNSTKNSNKAKELDNDYDPFDNDFSIFDNKPSSNKDNEDVTKRDDFAFFTKWGSWYSKDGNIHESGNSSIKRMNDPKQVIYVKQYQNRLKVTV